jgi:hypothetical protein
LAESEHGRLRVLLIANADNETTVHARLAAFETRYNAIARPFTWRFTRTDLSGLLRRIDAYGKTQPHALAA